MVSDIFFIMLHISLLMVIIVTGAIWRMANKAQIHYAFLTLMVLLFIWSSGQLLEIYSRSISGHTLMLFVNLYFLGLDFIPITVLFLGLIFANTKSRTLQNIFGYLFLPVYLI